MDLAHLGETLKIEIEERIFPNHCFEKRVLALLIYGSRVNGFERKNSDLDAAVIVDSDSPDLAFEYHGFFSYGSQKLPLELRVFSKSSAELTLQTDVVRAVSFTKAQGVFDPEGVLPSLLARARDRVQKEVESFQANATAYSSTDLLSLIQISAAEVRDIVRSSEDKMVQAARLLEFLGDFYAYTELLVLSRKPDLSRAERAFLFLSARPARLLDWKKYPCHPWFSNFLMKADLQNLEWTFNQLSEVFLDVTGFELFPAKGSLLEAWLN